MPAHRAATAPASPGAGSDADAECRSWLARLRRAHPGRATCSSLWRPSSLYPFLVSPFFTYQIGAQSLALGLIALSLTFLGGYGGMVSLAQMTVAGIAGYSLAIFGTAATTR